MIQTCFTVMFDVHPILCGATAGQTQGVIDDIAPWAEVIDRILSEATEILGARLPGYLA